MSALLALLVSSAALAAPAARPPDMSRPPSVGEPAVYRAPPRTRLKLDNGLEVHIVEDRRFPLLTARLAVRGGTALAPRDPGLVDAMAELLSEGSLRRSAKELAHAADAIGGDISAWAADDFIAVGVSALSEHKAAMLGLLAEVALEPAFAEGETALRKKNMLEELALNRSQPDFLASTAFYKKVYEGHPYGVYSPNEESIARIDRGRLQVLHRRLFHPANAVLVLVGDASRAELLPLLQASFGSWKPSPELPTAPVPPPAAKAAERRLAFVERPGSVQLTFAIGNLALARGHPQYYPLLLANQVVGGSYGARLTTDLRERRSYTYAVYSRLRTQRSGGAFVVAAQTRNEVAAAAIAAVLEHVERLRAEPVPEAELAQARNNLTGSFARSLETQGGLAGAVLNGLLLDLPLDYLDRYIQRVRGVSPAALREAARAHLRPDRAVIAAVGEPSLLPALAPLAPKGAVRVDYDGEDLPEGPNRP